MLYVRRYGIESSLHSAMPRHGEEMRSMSVSACGYVQKNQRFTRSEPLFTSKIPRLAHPRSAFVSCGMRSWWLLGGILLLGSFSLGAHSQLPDASRYLDLNASGPSEHSNEDEWKSYGEEPPQETEPSDPFPKQTLQLEGIPWKEGTPIYVLGENSSGQLVAYSNDYPGTSYAAVQQVKDTQDEYAESLASTDVNNILGRPTVEWVYGSGTCNDGNSGPLSVAYHFIKIPGPPKHSVQVRYCNDGLQTISIKRLG